MRQRLKSNNRISFVIGYNINKQAFLTRPFRLAISLPWQKKDYNDYTNISSYDAFQWCYPMVTLFSDAFLWRCQPVMLLSDDTFQGCYSKVECILFFNGDKPTQVTGSVMKNQPSNTDNFIIFILFVLSHTFFKTIN